MNDLEPLKQQVSINGPQKGVTTYKRSRMYALIKRVFDVLISGSALVVLSPIFAIIALLVALTSRGPVFFVHHRIGRYGKPLKILKFRTMVDNAEAMLVDLPEELKREFASNFKLDKDPRITKIGAFLRKSSLDELPQLVNILLGNMSLVGPRPITDIELQKYGDNKELFLSAMPGLTGYWQAYARNDCTYERRMEMELYYVNNASLWWDMKIIFATVGAVLRGSGAK